MGGKKKPENTQLVKVDAIRRRLARAGSIAEFKSIRDEAEALRRYVKNIGLDLEGQNVFAEAKLRAERGAGKLLLKMEQIKRGRPPKCDNSSHLPDLGISRKQSSRWQLEASLPDPDFAAFLQDTLKQARELTQSGLLKLAKRLQREAEFEVEHERRRREAEESTRRAVVHHMSARKFMGKIKDASVDLLLTDPPYSTEMEDVRAFADSWAPEALRKLKPTGRAYIFTGAYPEELAAYLAVIRGAKPVSMVLANVLVWAYRNTLGPTPKLDYKLNWQAVFHLRGSEAPPLDCTVMTEQFTVQDVNAPDGRRGDRFHAWQKPDELAERFVRHSTKPGDKVIDPFAGTGTFLLAAAKLGRRASGAELDRDVLKIAKARGCRIEG